MTQTTTDIIAFLDAKSYARFVLNAGESITLCNASGFDKLLEVHPMILESCHFQTVDKKKKVRDAKN